MQDLLMSNSILYVRAIEMLEILKSELIGRFQEISRSLKTKVLCMLSDVGAARRGLTHCASLKAERPAS